ncbi:MAG: twin-arginine translocase TatA/TatE family subunit [Actinobacteria bacterium]|nr:twin-arginine translocase TatA/TatE family subunit [Actinomycetota bacterium]
MIQNFGGGEILAIIILALVLLGPDRLPEMARNAGKLIHKLKTMANGLQGQVQGVMDDPAMQPLRELGEFAARPRQKLAEYALEAEAEERARAEQTSMEAAGADTTADGGAADGGAADVGAAAGTERTAEAEPAADAPASSSVQERESA